MKTENIKQILTGSIKESTIIRMQYADNYYKITGMPIKISDELVLIALINNLKFDGYIILSIAGIKSINYSESEKFIEHIMENEGNKNISKSEINIDGWYSSLSSIESLESIITLTIQSDGKNYFVGQVCSVDSDKVVLKEIDTCGSWGEHVTISINDIEEVELSNYYLDMLKKYQSQ